MSQATLIQHARNRAAHIHQNQPDRPSNRRVRPHTRPKTIDPIINVQLLHRRAIHDQQGSSAARRRRDPMQVKLLLAHRLDSRHNHRHVIRQAARHHRVDRHLLRRNHAVARRNHPQNITRQIAGILQKLFHPFRRRWHHRQPIRPPLLIKKLHRLRRVIQFNPPRSQRCIHLRLLIKIICTHPGYGYIITYLYRRPNRATARDRPYSRRTGLSSAFVV